MTESDFSNIEGDALPDTSDLSFTPTVGEMHADLLKLLRERVESEPIVLSAATGMGEGDLARSLLDNTLGYKLEPELAAGDQALLAARLTREVSEQLASRPIGELDEPGLDAEQARLKVSRHYGPRVSEALGAARGEAVSNWNLTDALGGHLERPLLVAHNAHRLPQPALWELRDLVGDGAIRLLLLSRPGHADRLISQDAPFFGMGWHVEMQTLPLAHWISELSSIHRDVLEALLRRTRFRTGATLDVILDAEFRSNPYTEIREAWRTLLHERSHYAQELLRIATAIHELAPRLLLILANGRAPYSVLSGERPARVSLALRRLYEYELIEQPKPRTWQIADPLLHYAFVRLEGRDEDQALLWTAPGQ